MNTLATAHKETFWTARAAEVKTILNTGLPLARWSAVEDLTAYNSDVIRWDGRIQGATKLGHFWVPNPWTVESVRLAAGKVGYPAVRASRMGLSQTGIARLCALVVESDRLSIPDQIAAADRLAAEGGFTWGAAVMSGDSRPESLASFNEITGADCTELEAGKSVHFYLWLDAVTVNEATLAQWAEAQSLLTLLMDGDRSLERIAQPVRYPGAFDRQGGKVRLQTLLTLNPTRWTLDAILPVLRRVAAGRGIDVPAAIAAMREGERLLAWANRHSKGLDLATQILRDKNISPATRQAIDALTDGEHVSPTSGELPGATRVKVWGTDKWTTVADLSTQPGFQPCTCPIHNHRDSHRAHVWTAPSGNVWLECFGSEGGKYLIRDSFRMQVEEGECAKLPLKGVDEKAWHTSGEGLESSAHNPNTRKFTKVTRYTPSNLLGGRYLPADPLNCQVTFLRGDKGIGKTEVMATYVKSLAHGERAVVSAHLRSLCRQAATRYDLPLYLDSKGILTESCVVSLDSIHRLDLNQPIDLLIIDEIQQYLQAFFSGTMTGTEAIRAYTTFKRVLTSAKRVVVADADLDLLAVDTLMGLLGDVTAEFRDVKTPSPYSYVSSKVKTDVEAEITASWLAGDRIAVAMYAKEDVESFAKFLQNQRPDAKIGIVNSLRILDSKLEISADPNGWAAQHDAIVYSPSLGTGISFDRPGLFDRVFGLFYASVGTAQAAFQMLHRVRHPNNKTVTFWAAPGGTLLEQRADKIEKQMLDRMFRTRTLLNEQGLRLEPAIAEADPEFLSLYARCTAYARQNGARGGHLYGAMLRYAQAGGLAHEELGAATPEQAKALRAARKVAADDTRESLAVELAGAPVVDLNDSQEPRTTAEALGIQKAHLLDFYGDVTPEILKLDAKGRYREQVKTFSRAVALTTAGNEPEVVELRHAALAADRREAKAGVTSHLHAYGYRAKLLATCLRAYGVDLRKVVDAGLDDQTLMIDSAGWAKATESLLKVRNKLANWGITLPQDAVTNGRHGRVLASLLAQVGLSLDYDRERIPGTKEFRYTRYRVELEGLKRTMGLGSRWLATQLHGVPGAVEVIDIDQFFDVVDVSFAAA